MGKVYHAIDDTHGRVLAYCQQNGIGVKQFVDVAIQAALKAKAVPVERKPLPLTTKERDDSGPKPWELPPFWANRSEAAPVEAKRVEEDDEDEDEQPKASASTDDVSNVAAAIGEPYQPISEMRLIGA